jgi:hypothetical protein
MGPSLERLLPVLYCFLERQLIAFATGLVAERRRCVRLVREDNEMAKNQSSL